MPAANFLDIDFLLSSLRVLYAFAGNCLKEGALDSFLNKILALTYYPGGFILSFC
jgi:hypothetical protein